MSSFFLYCGNNRLSSNKETKKVPGMKAKEKKATKKNEKGHIGE